MAVETKFLDSVDLKWETADQMAEKYLLAVI